MNPQNLALNVRTLPNPLSTKLSTSLNREPREEDGLPDERNALRRMIVAMCPEYLVQGMLSYDKETPEFF